MDFGAPMVVGFANLAHIGVLHFMPTCLAKLNFAVLKKKIRSVPPAASQADNTIFIPPLS